MWLESTIDSKIVRREIEATCKAAILRVSALTRWEGTLGHMWLWQWKGRLSGRHARPRRSVGGLRAPVGVNQRAVPQGTARIRLAHGTTRRLPGFTCLRPIGGLLMRCLPLALQGATKLERSLELHDAKNLYSSLFGHMQILAVEITIYCPQSY